MFTYGYRKNKWFFGEKKIANDRFAFDRFAFDRFAFVIFLAHFLKFSGSSPPTSYALPLALIVLWMYVDFSDE